MNCTTPAHHSGRLPVRTRDRQRIDVRGRWSARITPADSSTWSRAAEVKKIEPTK